MDDWIMAEATNNIIVEFKRSWKQYLFQSLLATIVIFVVFYCLLRNLSLLFQENNCCINLYN